MAIAALSDIALRLATSPRFCWADDQNRTDADKRYRCCYSIIYCYYVLLPQPCLFVCVSLSSRYKRVFSVGTHGITTYNPTTLEVTNQVSGPATRPPVRPQARGSGPSGTRPPVRPQAPGSGPSGSWSPCSGSPPAPGPSNSLRWV